jgi:hypothetical protein
MKTPLNCVARSRFVLPACLVLAAGYTLATFGTAAAQEETAGAPPDRAKLEEAFKEMLDGATLVGHFTLTGREATDLKEERYNLKSVEKLPNGRWLFRAQIRYGDHDVTVPLPLPVEWAGDTPMIVVDKLAIPGLGTFDARVMFFKDHYAGYWSGGDHGGHLFGVIKHEADENEDEAQKSRENRESTVE